MPIPGNPGRVVMLLKQLKLLKLPGIRNAHVGNRSRFYGSPAVCESVITSKANKKVSKDDRRAMVESYVNEYRAANGGKFPTLDGTIKEVGGGFYFVRGIFQELKVKRNEPLPIVAKDLLEVPASVPNDASSQAGTIKTGSDQRKATVDSSHPDSAEISLEGNDLVVTATLEKGETETVPDNGVDRKWDSTAHLPGSQKSAVLDESSKYSETEEEEIVMKWGTQETKSDHLEGAAVSVNVVPTEESMITKYSDEINLQDDIFVGTATQEKSTVLEESSKHSETEEEETVINLGTRETESDHLEGVAVSANVVPTEEANITKYSDEIDLQGDNLVVGTATQEERGKNSETKEEESSKKPETKEKESPKNSETKEEEILTHLGGQESKVAPTEETKITSQVSEKGAVEVVTEDRSSAWSNLMSFAKDFANFWRKK